MSETKLHDKPAKERVQFLDSLKFIIMIGIFCRHFMQIFYQCCDIKPPINQVVEEVIHSPFAIIIDSTFFLYFFYIISGYFATQKKVHTIKQLFLIWLKRYLRFLIPFFVINLMIYAVYALGCFPTQEMSGTLNNQWLGNYYGADMNIITVIRESLLLGAAFNSPFWMIAPLFLGTCLVYSYNYCITKWNPYCCTAIYAVAMATLYISGWIENFQISCICFGGVLLDKIWKKWKGTGSLPATVAIIIIVLLQAGLHSVGYNVLTRYVQDVNVFAPSAIWSCIYAFFIILLLKYSCFLKGILESNILRKISHLSFAIYVLHWPILCSVSLYLYKVLITGMSYTVMMAVNFSITAIAVFVLAKLYNITIEKWENKFLHKRNI